MGYREIDTPVRVDVGIPRSLLDSCHSAQQGAMWCWAAVTQTVLAFHGVSVDQAEIVAQTFGCAPPPDWPASLDQILKNLNAFTVRRDGRRVTVRATLHQGANFGLLRDELCYRRPLILALGSESGIGHTVLGTAIAYDNRNGNVSEVVVRDPSPLAGEDGRRTLTGMELAAIQAIWTVRVEPFPEGF